MYKLIKEIKCVILGNYNDSSIFNDPKINIIFQSLDISLFEKQTINMLYNDCINTRDDDTDNDKDNEKDFNVLYIHSKGVRHYGNEKCEKNVYDWVEYLSYFNIYNHSECLKELNNCDAIGVNLLQAIDCPLHYSGNFWWSKSSHIRKINVINDNYYNSPEFWVTSVKGIYKSLWYSNTNHYHSDYSYKKYENKISDTIIIEK